MAGSFAVSMQADPTRAVFLKIHVHFHTCSPSLIPSTSSLVFVLGFVYNILIILDHLRTPPLKHLSTHHLRPLTNFHNITHVHECPPSNQNLIFDLRHQCRDYPAVGSLVKIKKQVELRGPLILIVVI